MSLPVNSIADVVSAQLCLGCGACAYIEHKRFRMGDTLEYGRRPFIRERADPETGEAFAVCPGISLQHTTNALHRGNILPSLFDGWGPVVAVWEGYAVDDELRFSGSSGGVASALALYCIERAGMAGVLHTAAQSAAPYLNETVMSTCRADLLARTGSRYAPASPAEGLACIEDSPSKCVFIGKPCDAAAVQSARKIRPVLDDKLGLVLAFFCAGVPSTKGNLDLLKANGVEDLSKIKELRYRGKGWPGMWTARFENQAGGQETRQMTYADSWNYLQKYRQWRCYICPDHTGEFADIAVGDPWYRKVQPGERGKSLIVARTRHGVEVLQAAVLAGYVVLESEDPNLLPRSQSNLLATRGALWARLWVLRLLGAAVPSYTGFGLFKFWISALGFKEKLRSVTGTVKRVFQKNLNKATDVPEWDPTRKQ
jgi:coenzyme F420 hydrogenase subunit beta